MRAHALCLAFALLAAVAVPAAAHTHGDDDGAAPAEPPSLPMPVKILQRTFLD